MALIFGRFGRILGSKLGWKIHKKSFQKDIEKTMQKRRRLGKDFWDLGGVLGRILVLGPCKNSARTPHRWCAVAGSQRPLFRIPKDFYDI